MNGASENPLLSIIVPSFNQGAFIRKTIESCLQQDYRPIEIVVIDGASTDDTVPVLKSFGSIPELRWISERDSGVVEAVNKGLKIATGVFGAIQSSDDCYLPGAFRLATRQLQEHPECGLVYGDIEKIDVSGALLSRTQLAPFSLEGLLSKATWIPQPSCFFRMSAARDVKGWRESVSYAADADMWLRILLIAEGWKFDAHIAQRRMHAEQRDVQGERVLSDYVRMINDFFTVYKAPECLRAAADAGLMRMRRRYGRDAGAVDEAVSRFPPLSRLEAVLPADAAGGVWRRLAARWRRWATT